MILFRAAHRWGDVCVCVCGGEGGGGGGGEKVPLPNICGTYPKMMKFEVMLYLRPFAV